MSLTPAGRNSLMADSGGFGGNWIGLHSGFPGTNFANEISGGSPEAYARKNGSFSAPSDGQRALTSPLSFAVPASTIRWLTRGTAESGGTQLEVQPNGGSEKDFQVVGTDTIRCVAHGYANGTKVVFYGGGVPTGITEGQIYYVVETATDTFKIATTLGGAAKTDISTQPGEKCRVSLIVESVYSGQGTFTVNTLISRIS